MIVASRRAGLLSLLVLVAALLCGSVAWAHPHDGGTSTPDSCGLCMHAASVAATAARTTSKDVAPRVERVPPACRPALEEACRAEHRERDPPAPPAL